MRPMVNRINRQPIDTPAVEVTNTIYVITSRDRQKEVLDILEQALEQAEYPIGDLAIHAFGEDDVEIEATLAATSVDGDDLDRLVQQLKDHAIVGQAFWSPSTSE